MTPQYLYITSVEHVTSLKALSQEDQASFRAAKEEEIWYLIYKHLVKPVSVSDVPHNHELQVLKWVQ